MAGSRTRDWDASTYQRVALPHEDWARAVLDRLGLEGGETVLDAGCGSGRTTAIVIERVPDGRVIAVDGSPSMVDGVKEVLRPQDTALVSDLTKLELEEQVDAVFRLPASLREHAMWRVLHDAGAPASEVLALDADQLDLSRHRVRHRACARGQRSQEDIPAATVASVQDFDAPLCGTDFGRPTQS